MLLWMIKSLVVGLLAGAIARALHPGSDKMGWWSTAGLGMLGAVIATFLGQKIGHYGPNQSAGWIASILGAIAVLSAYRCYQRSRSQSLKGPDDQTRLR